MTMRHRRRLNAVKRTDGRGTESAHVPHSILSLFEEPSLVGGVDRIRMKMPARLFQL